MGQTSLTDHAVTRWCERFPAHDIEAAFLRSRPVGYHLLLMEARRTGQPFRFSPDATYRRDGETRAVFVLRPDNRRDDSWTVVTVVKFTKPKVCRPPANRRRGRAT